MVNYNSKVTSIKFDVEIDGKWYNNVVVNNIYTETPGNKYGDLFSPDFSICKNISFDDVDDAIFTLQVKEEDFDYDMNDDEVMTLPLLPLLWYTDEDGFVDLEDDEMAWNFKNLVITTTDGDVTAKLAE